MYEDPEHASVYQIFGLSKFLQVFPLVKITMLSLKTECQCVLNFQRKADFCNTPFWNIPPAISHPASRYLFILPKLSHVMPGHVERCSGERIVCRRSPVQRTSPEPAGVRAQWNRHPLHC